MSTPRPGPQHGPEEREEQGGEERREEARQHGRHVLDDALLGLDQPGGDQDGAGRAARRDQLEEGLGLDPDGLEEHPHERHEHAAAEGDQDVVDEQLARESNEVHAARDLVPTAAGVGDPHDQPERDRQVQRREHFGAASRLEGIDIGEHTRREKRPGEPADGAGGEPPLPDEVAGQQWQHEEARIPGVEAPGLVHLDPEERRQLDEHGRRHGQSQGDEGIRSGPRPRLTGVRGDDELLPEPLRVLASELPGEGVELAHALHRHQERFIGGEPRAHEGRRPARADGPRAPPRRRGGSPAGGGGSSSTGRSAPREVVRDLQPSAWLKLPVEVAVLTPVRR